MLELAQNSVALKQHSQRDHFSKQLAEIEKDVQMERISEVEAAAAKAELAREVLRFEQSEKTQTSGDAQKLSGDESFSRALPFATTLSFVFVVGATFGAYFYLGNPTLPSNPLATRTDQPVEEMTLDAAVARIEERLEQVPDDLQGWQTVAPVYMRMQRFQDAANAFAQVNELSTPTAETLTDQAEALLMLNNGNGGQQTLELLTRAAALDDQHIRSRFYLAGQATQDQDWSQAETLWSELLALSNGDESWVAAAQRGLELAKSDGLAAAPPQSGIDALGLDEEQQGLVQGMVSGLAARLYEDGGTLEEWTRLVRSRLVLADVETAQSDYLLAIAAYPNSTERQELDALAEQAGLSASTPDATNEE